MSLKSLFGTGEAFSHILDGKKEITTTLVFTVIYQTYWYSQSYRKTNPLNQSAVAGWALQRQYNTGIGLFSHSCGQEAWWNIQKELQDFWRQIYAFWFLVYISAHRRCYTGRTISWEHSESKQTTTTNNSSGLSTLQTEMVHKHDAAKEILSCWGRRV